MQQSVGVSPVAWRWPTYLIWQVHLEAVDELVEEVAEEAREKLRQLEQNRDGGGPGSGGEGGGAGGAGGGSGEPKATDEGQGEEGPQPNPPQPKAAATPEQQREVEKMEAEQEDGPRTANDSWLGRLLTLLAPKQRAVKEELNVDAASVRGLLTLIRCVDRRRLGAWIRAD